MKISKVKLGRYALLRHKKYRDKEKLFIVQGRKAVEDTIGKFKAEAFMVVHPEDFPFLKNEKDVFNVSEMEMRKISTLDNLPDIIAVYEMPQTHISLKIKKGESALVIDGVQDPGNLGTIIRTAHWFGLQKIFCSKDTVDLFNPKTIMATMGSIASVSLKYCELSKLFDQNPEIPVYGLLLDGEDLFKVGRLQPGFIVMGSEGHGPSEETLNRITRGLTIPAVNPSDAPDSLNVAIATAITLSQIIQ